VDNSETIVFDVSDDSFEFAPNMEVSLQESGSDLDSATFIYTIMIRPIDVIGMPSDAAIVKRQLVNFGAEKVYEGSSFETTPLQLSPVITANDFKLADNSGDLSVWPGSYHVEYWDGTDNEPMVVAVTITGNNNRLVIPFPL
jgi:hypothetical protein